MGFSVYRRLCCSTECIDTTPCLYTTKQGKIWCNQILWTNPDVKQSKQKQYCLTGNMSTCPMTWGRFITIQDSQNNAVCMVTRSYCSSKDCYTLLYNWQLWRYCFVFSLKFHQQLSYTARSVPVNNLFVTVNTPTWLDLCSSLLISNNLHFLTLYMDSTPLLRSDPFLIRKSCSWFCVFSFSELWDTWCRFWSNVPSPLYHLRPAGVVKKAGRVRSSGVKALCTSILLIPRDIYMFMGRFITLNRFIYYRW